MRGSGSRTFPAKGSITAVLRFVMQVRRCGVQS